MTPNLQSLRFFLPSVSLEAAPEPSQLPLDTDIDGKAVFEAAAEELVKVGRSLYKQGWSPATSSNYSIRLNECCCAITTSGKDKGSLVLDDIMVVDWQGNALSAGKPSAETLLHTHLYQRFQQVGAILHTHSPMATLLSRRLGDRSHLTLSGYELLKAFAGITTHETTVEVPIFENTQDITQLAQTVDDYLQNHPQTYGYLIRGHGLYTWGKDMAETLRHLEAFEFLLGCEWEEMRL